MERERRGCGWRWMVMLDIEVNYEQEMEPRGSTFIDLAMMATICKLASGTEHAGCLHGVTGVDRLELTSK
jgi:hypothetical protein